MQAEIRESGKKVKTVSRHVLGMVSFVAARAVGTGRVREMQKDHGIQVYFP